MILPTEDLYRHLYDQKQCDQQIFCKTISYNFHNHDNTWVFLIHMRFEDEFGARFCNKRDLFFIIRSVNDAKYILKKRVSRFLLIVTL